MRAITLESQVVQASHQVSTPLGEETVVLDLQAEEYLRLNPVASRIWQLIRQPRRVSEVIHLLEQEFDVERPRLERDVLHFLQQLLEQGLIRLL